MKKKTKFYEFDQNNSGGSFVVNENLCHRIVIEAYSEKEAIEKAEELGCYWNGCDDGSDCPCCGDRWYASPNEIKLSDMKKVKTIEQYCQLMANAYGWTTPDVRIHFLNGTKKEIFMNKIKD